MIIHFSAPSKTFLAGEYAVLSGGPALVINTEPRFTFVARPGLGRHPGFPVGSPAERWIVKQEKLLRDWDLEFTDPHAGKGGFGASSAQFLFVHALTTLLEITTSRAAEGLDLKTLLEDFKSLVTGPASGADILAQATGTMARVAAGSASAMSWPYPDLDFAILRTGNKICTHEHLAKLSLKPTRGLVAPAIAAVERFGTEDFLSALKNFSAELRVQGLQAPETMALLREVENQPWCKAAKGCGAMGADTLVVLFATEDRETAQAYFKSCGWDVVADVTSISRGLDMKWS